MSDKSGIEEFARGLVERFGYQLLSTGGTARLLREAGLAVTEVGDYTGFPEMMEGRIKTLHPKIHGGLLCRRDSSEHMAEAAEHGIGMIDLVVVNLYPFEQTVAQPGCQFDAAIENIDIGGPSMLRSAAKNHASVTVVCDPLDYPRVLDVMAADNEGDLLTLRRDLAFKVFQRTASYDAAIAAYLEEQLEPPASDHILGLPSRMNLSLPRAKVLRYGENPHQKAGFYSELYPPSQKFEKLQGKELSFNNLLDLDSAFEIACNLEKPSAAIIKHTNPCGAASAENISSAYSKAYECDPVSAFGSVVGFNREVDKDTAGKIAESPFVEAVVAPAFSEEALETLAEKKNMRLIKADVRKQRAPARDIKKVAWGILVQDKDNRDVEPSSLKVVTKRKPSDEEFASLLFAWKIAKHVKSNSIVLANATETVGVGGGQMSRLDSVIIACRKAGERADGAVMGSDAFFPFPDGIEEAAKHGVKAVIQPGGSVKDKEVIEACDRLGIAMVFTGMRHFKH